MVANGPQSVHSCHDLCYQRHSCNVFWLLKDTCILADCRTPHHCQPSKMDARDSLLVFLDKERTSWTLPFHRMPDIISQEEYPSGESHGPGLKRGTLLRVKRQERELRDQSLQKEVPMNPALVQDSASKKDHKTITNNTAGNKETEVRTCTENVYVFSYLKVKSSLNVFK